MPRAAESLSRVDRRTDGSWSVPHFEESTDQYDCRWRGVRQELPHPLRIRVRQAEGGRQQKNETIEEYRLFNNLLSSQPMAFNLFCPLIQLMHEGKEALVTQIVQAIFPTIAIGRVTEVGLEYLHTDIENYLGDKTAMDAIIRYHDPSGRPCFIAIETKYTDVLGENSASRTERQKALISQLQYFQPEAEAMLLDGRKAISHSVQKRIMVPVLLTQ